ncbi:MAG: hypothetical protein J2P59_06940 [Acidimicrobiales bacterium]|nr:hypothetical protein [Acidimicrobiales bacterium]
MARAAATGGGRTVRRGRAPIGWYLVLALIVVAGTATVAFSRYQLIHPPPKAASGPSPAGPPTLTDHWTAAIGFDICGSFEPNLPRNKNYAQAGIHTNGDGLIQITPLSSADTGARATLGRFVTLYKGLDISSSQITIPNRGLWSNGVQCGKQKGSVVVKEWPSASSQPQVVSGNPQDLRLKNGQLITVAFVPSGTSVPKPPSAAKLPGAQSQSSSSTTTTSHP